MPNCRLHYFPESGNSYKLALRLQGDLPLHAHLHAVRRPAGAEAFPQAA
jgi:hypothetical protein